LEHFPLTEAALDWALANPDEGFIAIIGILILLAFLIGDHPAVRKVVNAIMD
jgi:hypothetical protein